MSIVLDALEKIEKEKNKSTQNQDKFFDGGQDTKTAVIEKKQAEQLIALSIDNPSLKKETACQQDKILLPSEVKPKATTKLRYGKKLFVLTIFSFTAAIILVFYNYHFNKKDSDPEIIPAKTVNVPPKPIEIPITAPSKIAAIKDILLDNNPPQLKVTGVVWEEKDPIVLVNSKFLKQGDEILGVKVVKIEPTEATFLYNNKEFTISVE